MWIVSRRTYLGNDSALEAMACAYLVLQRDEARYMSSHQHATRVSSQNECLVRQPVRDVKRCAR